MSKSSYLLSSSRQSDSGNESSASFYSTTSSASSSSDPDSRATLALPSLSSARPVRGRLSASSHLYASHASTSLFESTVSSSSAPTSHQVPRRRRHHSLPRHGSSGASLSSSFGESKSRGIARTTSSSSLYSIGVGGVGVGGVGQVHHSSAPELGRKTPARRWLPAKVKPWTVHVTWYSTNIAFSKNKRTVILRPFHENGQLNCEFNATSIQSKESVLDQKIFKKFVEYMKPNVMLPGYFQTKNFPHKPGGFLVNMQAIDARERERSLVHFANVTGIDMPSDDLVVSDSIAYSCLVEKFITKFYFYLNKMYGISDDDQWITTSLKVAFHGPKTAPAFLMLNRLHSFDNMSTSYLISTPVIGNCLPYNEYGAQDEALHLGMAHWYAIERAAVKNADLLFSVLKGNWSKLTKRHYGRLTNNSTYFAYGKCKYLAIKKPKSHPLDIDYHS